MAKRYCECGKPAVTFRRIRKRGRKNGSLKVFSDDSHALCYGCDKRLFEQMRQEQKFEKEKE